MSLKLGTITIAGVSKETTYISNAHQLLDFKWSDHLLDDVSWLRADTFSWQSGDVYESAYNHLVQDIQGITAETETTGSYTVTFYRATDGHKICLANQEQTILNIYNETGIAWYYILDITNTQFKLPRTKYGFEGVRGNVGDNINESLPNITGRIAGQGNRTAFQSASGAFYKSGEISGSGAAEKYDDSCQIAVELDASRSSSTYQDNAPVQERATQMYLYFYVGDYAQTAIEQTAGLNAELFNGKVDLPIGRNQSSIGLLVENYVNGTSWYRVYSDGWCEQGGVANNTGPANITLLKNYINTDYSIGATTQDHVGSYTGCWTVVKNKTVSGFKVYGYYDAPTLSVNTAYDFIWVTRGYIN